MSAWYPSFPIIVPTSDRTASALPGFAHQLNKYWPTNLGRPRVMIYGYTGPMTPMPLGFQFTSMGKFADYPVQRWSDRLIEHWGALIDPIALLMMDDYWLNRQVNVDAILMLATYMYGHPEVARIDLTTDRLYSRDVHPHGSLGYLDLLRDGPDAPYHLSLQAGLWRREALVKYMLPGETPWQTEINGTMRMHQHPEDLVLGTRQRPLSYTIVCQQGKWVYDGGYQVPANPLPTEDLAELSARGLIVR